LTRFRWHAQPQSFSETWYEAAYRQRIDLAFATVPYYREMWAVACERLTVPPPLCATAVDESLQRLYPIGAPPRHDLPPGTGGPGALFEALRMTGTLPAGWHVFEIRESLLDWTRLAPGVAYTALLAHCATAQPEARSHGEKRLHAAPRRVLVGSAAQLNEYAPVWGPKRSTRAYLRGDWTSGLAIDEPAWGLLLHDRHLGYFGARTQSCGFLHVNWKRYYVRQGNDSPLLTHLQGDRPMLAEFAPHGAHTFSVNRCRVHGTPVFVPRQPA
jgi:hypothetical protein